MLFTIVMLFLFALKVGYPVALGSNAMFFDFSLHVTQEHL